MEIRINPVTAAVNPAEILISYDIGHLYSHLLAENQEMMMMMMKLPILPCAEKLES